MAISVSTWRCTCVCVVNWPHFVSELPKKWLPTGFQRTRSHHLDTILPKYGSKAMSMSCPIYEISFHYTIYFPFWISIQKPISNAANGYLCHDTNPWDINGTTCTPIPCCNVKILTPNSSHTRDKMHNFVACPSHGSDQYFQYAIFMLDHSTG